MSRAFIVAVGLVANACTHTPQQVQPLSTPLDSAGLRVAILRVALNTLVEGDRGSTPIWVQPYSERDPSTGEIHHVDLTPREWDAIVRAFPTVRRAEGTDTLFLCPPGVQLRMPGQGCPIRDDGIVVSFRPIQSSFETGITVTRSIVGANGLATWAQGFRARFRMVDGDWALEEVTLRWVT